MGPAIISILARRNYFQISSDDDFYSANVPDWNRDQESPNGFVSTKMCARAINGKKAVAELLRHLCPLLAGYGREKEKKEGI